MPAACPPPPRWCNGRARRCSRSAARYSALAGSFIERSDGFMFKTSNMAFQLLIEQRPRAAGALSGACRSFLWSAMTPCPTPSSGPISTRRIASCRLKLTQKLYKALGLNGRRLTPPNGWWESPTAILETARPKWSLYVALGTLEAQHDVQAAHLPFDRRLALADRPQRQDVGDDRLVLPAQQRDALRRQLRLHQRNRLINLARKTLADWRVGRGLQQRRIVSAGQLDGG